MASQRRVLQVRGGQPDERSFAIAALRVQSLLESTQGLRLAEREAVKWSALLGDFATISTSLRLLRESIPNNFNTMAVVPHNVAVDLSSTRLIPDLLYTHPGEQAYAEAEELFDRFRGENDGRRALSQQEVRQRRGRIMEFNQMLDKLLLTINDAAAATFTTSDTAMLAKSSQFGVKSRAQLQKERDELKRLMNTFYRGTTLEIY